MLSASYRSKASCHS